ncbi:MAG TPA: hypothetical protein VG323_19830, partial [Thermoanaerobaculia bacterium]|nr:hypothetical protein [Thermoanaerobaculia bacterium]
AGLRVYLQRPWYLSGDGELLGVVLSATPAFPDKPTEDRLGNVVTHWGLDPTRTFPTAMPTLPTAGSFRSYAHVRTGVALDEVGAGGPRVTVVGYQPIFDPARKLWYCDVELDRAPSYATFIRLALVRFQPGSIRDHEISRVVPAEFAQLLSNRTASVTRVDRNTLCVRIGGDVVPADGRNEFNVRVEHQCIEERGIANWLPLSVTSSPCSSDPAGTLFSRLISLPHDCGPLRLIIEEFENLDRDPDTDPHPVRRLIYADVVELL